MAEGEDDSPRDLGALVVPAAGGLVETGDLWEPYCLSDPGGGRVEPVSEFLRDLQAAGRPATTQRSYSLALLRWFRFTWAVDVPWDQATRAEARDFCRHLQLSDKPGRQRAVPSPVPGQHRRPVLAGEVPGSRSQARREPLPQGRALRAGQPGPGDLRAGMRACRRHHRCLPNRTSSASGR